VKRKGDAPVEKITDHESERRVLSAMLHDGNACTEAVDRLTDTDFNLPVHAELFTLAKDLYMRQTKPTYVEIIKEGTKLGWMKQREEQEQLQYIVESYINDENIVYWIEKVREASKGRQVQRLMESYEAKLTKGQVKEVIQAAGNDFFSLSMDLSTERIITPQETAERGIKAIRERSKKYRETQEDCQTFCSPPLEGVPTGIHKLDLMTLGSKPGDLIVLGAQTGHGKTAYALNNAKAVCIDGGKNMLYVNTEMSEKQLEYRWGAILAGVPLQQIREGSVTDAQLNLMAREFNELALSGFYHITIPNLTPEKLMSVAKQAKQQYNISQITLDYVGRMETVDPRLQEWQMLYQIIKIQKMMAQNLEIACMCLVQLNPDGTIQGAKKIKNECDLMLKLVPVDDDQRQQVEEKNKKHYEPFNYRLFVDKARDAESGVSIPLVFDLPRQQIMEAALR
jgi:replicative DNA helicase